MLKYLLCEFVQIVVPLSRSVYMAALCEINISLASGFTHQHGRKVHDQARTGVFIARQ